ncbi:hypothetical protein D3C87_1958890 [compost metagenome]
MLIKTLAALGERDTFAAPHKQLRRHALLQLFYRLRQRRLREIHYPTGPANTPLTRHFDKRPNLVKFYLKCHNPTDNRCLSE